MQVIPEAIKDKWKFAQSPTEERSQIGGAHVCGWAKRVKKGAAYNYWGRQLRDESCKLS